MGGNGKDPSRDGRARLEAEAAKLAAEVGVLRLRVEELEEQHEFDERRHAVLARDRDVTRARSEDAVRRLAEREAEGEKLREHVAERDAERERLREQVTERDAERERLRQQVTERDAERERLREQVTERDAERERLREQVTERDAERERLRAEAREIEAEGDRLRVEVDRLERALGSSTDERDELRRRVGTLEHEIETLRVHADELRAMIDAERTAAAEVSEELAAQRQEHRALMTDLIRTQGTLQARSDQLRNALTSRSYRVARAAWHLRRRRPPVSALVLAVVALVGAVGAVATAGHPAALRAGLVSAAIGAGLAAAYAVLAPALRDHRPPRLAGDESYAQSLSGESTASLEPPADAAGAPSPAPVAPATTTRPSTLLVPAAVGGVQVDLERTRWLAGARVPGLANLRVAGILDDMSQACFAPECELDTSFGLEDWRERLEASPPHLLLVESAWSGNGGGWQYGVGSYTHPRYAGLLFLRELLGWCRERGVPTVFWNKEDPVHFERFKEAGALFDHVFTTDADRLPAYDALHGEHVRSVEVLPFAAQPRLHNPIAVEDPRRMEPVFAGTCYRNRHAQRRSSLEMILDAARPFGLVIYDRRHGTTSDEFGFSERFRPHVRGRLPYREMIEVYKRHRVFINVNSVADSPTMFSRRVFELLACGTAVLSTESTGMEAVFADLVPVARTTEEATAALERLLHDADYHADLTLHGRRLVLGEHTYRDRLAQIARTAGFDLPAAAGEEVAALVVVDEATALDPVVDALLAQTIPPAEILLGLRAGVTVDRALDRLTERFGTARVRTVVQEAGVPVSGRVRELAAIAASPWVAPLRPDVAYGEDHLRDLVSCTRYADAQVLGPAAPGADRVQRYESVTARPALAARDLVAARGWPEDETALRDWFAQGVRFFTGDPEPTADRRAPTPASAEPPHRR